MENDISVDQETFTQTQTQTSTEPTTRLDESIQDPLQQTTLSPKQKSTTDGTPEDDNNDESTDETLDDTRSDETSRGGGGGGTGSGSPDEDPDDKGTSLEERSEPRTDTPKLDDKKLDDKTLDTTVQDLDEDKSEEVDLDKVGTDRVDTELTSPKVDTPKVPGLTLSPDLFQIDMTSVDGPETFLKDDPAWKSYQSGEMSGETRKRYEGDLGKARQKVEGIVTTANTSLTSERTSREKTESDTKAKLEVDQQKAEQDKAKDVKGAEDEKARKTREATSAANKEHYAAEAKAEQDKAKAKSKTQGDINAERTRVDGQKAAKRRDANSRASRVKSDAQAEKRRRVAQAEKEEQEKYWYEKAWDYVASAWERIKDSVNAMINRAWDIARGIIAAADRAIRDLASSFSSWMSKQWAAFEAVCAEIGANLQTFISNTWASAKKKWANFKAEMSRRITEIGKQFQETMSQLAADAQAIIDNSMTYLKERGSEILTSVTTSISTSYDEVRVLWNRYDGEELAPDKELFLTPEGRADWLYKAVRGVGADSTMVLRCLRGSVAENKKLAAHLQTKYGLVLTTVLNDELSGAELAMAIDLVEGGTVKLHNKIRRAIDGWGADTEAVIKLVESPSTSKEERYQLLHDPNPPKEVKAVRDRLIGEIGWAAFNRLKKGVSDGEDGTEQGAIVQTPEALLARLKQRGAGGGTDEAGMYTDLKAFAKKYPADARVIGTALGNIARGEPYTKPPGLGGQILYALTSELGGRDLDKAVAALMGGGGKKAIEALGDDPTTATDAEISTAIDELFRPILLTMDSEDYRWYTDEARMNADLAEHWKAVNELKTKVGDTVFEKIKKHKKYIENDAKVRKVMKSELDAAELAKAKAMLEHGKQNNIDKLREEVETMIITDRSCLDAIIAMDATERKKLALDKALLAKIEAGVSVANYSRIKDILGITSDGKAKEETKANADRLAAVIIDAVDGSDKLDQAYDAVLDAQMLVAAKKLVMEDLFKAVKARNGLYYMPKTAPSYKPLWDALEGKKTLTSSDRLKAATDGAGTDEAGIKETIKDLRGKDLLDNWTNIDDYKAILKEIEDATKAGDTRGAEIGQIKKKQFILTISASADAVLKRELGGKDYTETRKALMDKIKEASTKDPVFIKEVGQAGLKIDKLYHEKMEYMQSVLEKDVHYEEGMNLVDGFTTKDEQLKDAHGDYMGTLRTGMQELEQGKEGVTQESVIKATDEKQKYFEGRLKAYRDMKAAVANTVALILSTVVAVVLTIVTGGLGAGVAGAVLAGMIAGAGGAAAGAIAKEAIMGGDYDFWSQGTTEILIGGLAGAVGGGIGKSLGGVKSLANFAKNAGSKVTNNLSAFGGKVSGYIGQGIEAAIPKLPESLMTNVAMEPVNQMLGTDGFLRLGWDGVADKVGPAVISNASKDVAVTFFTGGIKLARSGDDFTDDIIRASDDEVSDLVTKQTSKQFVDNVVEGTVGTGYDVVASEGRKELTVTDGLKVLSDASKGTAKNYKDNKTTVSENRMTVVNEDGSVTTVGIKPEPTTTDDDVSTDTEEGKTLDKTTSVKKVKVVDTEDETLDDDGLPVVKTKEVEEHVETDDNVKKTSKRVDEDEDEDTGVKIKPEVEEEDVKVKTKGVEEEQISDAGLYRPVPLDGAEKARVLQWQDARNEYLKKWREFSTDGFGEATQKLLWGGKADNSVTKNMTPDDLAAVIKERRGVDILHPRTGKKMDHIQEATQAQNSLTKALTKIQAHIKLLQKDGTAAEGEIAALEEKVVDLSVLMGRYGF